jgi:hypothetical protein
MAHGKSSTYAESLARRHKEILKQALEVFECADAVDSDFVKLAIPTLKKLSVQHLILPDLQGRAFKNSRKIFDILYKRYKENFEVDLLPLLSCLKEASNRKTEYSRIILQGVIRGAISLKGEITGLSEEDQRFALEKEDFDKIRNAAIPILIAERLSKLSEKMEPLSYSPEFNFNERLERDDYVLMLAWGDRRPIEDDPLFISWHKLLGKLDAARFWSARIGEITAAEFYESLGSEVEDIAIHQINGASDNWKLLDFKADGKFYDVKTARRSFSSPNSYSEFIVPQFKKDRTFNEDVRIVGVLSEYIKIEDVKIGKQGQRVVLGEVSSAEISSLRQWIIDQFGGVLDFEFGGNDQLLPGWLFEYPVNFYEGRPERISAISSLACEWIEFGLPASQFPKVYLPLIEDESIAAYFLKGREELIIWNELMTTFRAIGLSRRALFVFILCFSLRELKSDSYRPKDLLEWLFIDLKKTKQVWVNFDKTIKNWSGVNRPLWLLDTEEYIYQIIWCLTEAWDSSKTELRSYRRFRLRGFRILQGHCESRGWQTILAYCGGWRSNPVAPCGSSPLIVGQNSRCEECQKLVCKACGFCTKICGKNAERQREVANMNYII